MKYEILQEIASKGGQEEKKFYYTYHDNSANRIVKRVCRGCTTLEEARIFASQVVEKKGTQYLIMTITRSMYFPGSSHLTRLQNFGRNLCQKTIHQKRQFIELIQHDFGNQRLDKLQIKTIEEFLIKDTRHSGSWKNFYLDTFGEIYTESIWMCEKPISKPRFMRFARNTKKADILATEELINFLSFNNWSNYRDFLIFLCISSCGLRVGEARALRVDQILFEDKFLLINGFCLYNGQRTNYNKKGSCDNKKIRVAPLPDQTYLLLKNYVDYNHLKDSDFIFQSETKKPLTQKYLEKTFKKQICAAGINTDARKLVPQSLRYTYVTRMRRDLNVELVQKIVGHTTVAMTEYYTRNIVDDMVRGLEQTKSAANKLFSN